MKEKSKGLSIVLIVLETIIIGLLIALIVILITKKVNTSKDEVKEIKEEEKNINIEYTNTSSKDYESYLIDVSDVVENVMPSIVSITSKSLISSGFFNFNREVEGAGSGIIIKQTESEIFILTNYHVVKNTNELSVQFIDNNSCDAKIKGVSKRKDIAVVSVSKKDLKKETLEKIKIAIFAAKIKNNTRYL